jgi:hypothetical protein
MLMVAINWSFNTVTANHSYYTYSDGGGPASSSKSKTSTRSSRIHKSIVSNSFAALKMDVYDSLHLEEAGLSKKAFTMALESMGKLLKTRTVRDDIISIADFTQPSVNKRLYVIDLSNYQLLFNTLVAHGHRSGTEYAESFSNRNSSNKSSLGMYITGETYEGSNGYSLKLIGTQKGVNDHALRRGIVLHGADYVSDQYAAGQGYIGRSWGCPAVPLDVCQPLIDEVKDGTCLYIYHPSLGYHKATAKSKKKPATAAKRK